LQDPLNDLLAPPSNLVEENKLLLSELEEAYKNMELILEQSSREKELAYDALQQKFQTLEDLYAEMTNKENLLIHLEKLSSIGQFIAEIVHELNNPLTVISMQADVAMMMAESEPLKKQISKIPPQVARMINLLDRFRKMAYKSEEEFCLFNLNESLRDCLNTINIIKPKKIEMISEFCENDLIITGDPYQVNQIFLNLAKNAFDAMIDKGKHIEIKTQKVSSEWLLSKNINEHIYCQDSEVWNGLLKDTEHFALAEFSDDGPGIGANLLKDVFKAFFTTKDRTKGTGLGLSISSDIVVRHHGNLVVQSKVGEGTTFQLLLPISK